MNNSQRGDTIIEVILASAMLALVTVSTFAIMQRASSSAYDAMERSAVRLQLNGQIELLNYFRDSYSQAAVNGDPITGTPAEMWQTIANNATTPPVSAPPTLETCAAPAGAFYISRSTSGPAKYQILTNNTAATGLPVPGSGLWIAKISPTGAAPLKKYQEFYIVACWPTTTAGEQRMSSVVRLYDPIGSVGSPSGDSAQVANQPGIPGPPGSIATRYYFSANFIVSSNTVPASGIAGCTWYWNDDSVPGGQYINGTNGCAAGTAISHNFVNDSRMQTLLVDHPFPDACSPTMFPGVSGAGRHTYQVYMVINKVGGGAVTTQTTSVTKPDCIV